MDILITGGIGDFICVESHMSPAEKASVNKVYLATRAEEGIRNLLDSYPIFPNLTGVITVWTDWSEIFGFVHHEQMRDFLAGRQVELPPMETVDYSIFRVFPQIAYGERRYHGSSLLRSSKAELIQDFGLPDVYCVINPYSPNDRQNGVRDFTSREWESVLKLLSRSKRIGVVVNHGDDLIPQHEMLRDLSLRTTLTQAVEVIKKARWFIGIDSFVPALAAQFMPPEHMVVKTRNAHYISYLPIYLAPHRHFDFVHCGLTYLSNWGDHDIIKYI